MLWTGRNGVEWSGPCVPFSSSVSRNRIRSTHTHGAGLPRRSRYAAKHAERRLCVAVQVIEVVWAFFSLRHQDKAIDSFKDVRRMSGLPPLLPLCQNYTRTCLSITRQVRSA